MNDAAVGAHGGRVEPGGRRLARIVAVVVAVALQIVVLVPFTVGSGLLAPMWAIVAFYLLWAGFALVLVRTIRRRPLVAPVVPLVNGALLWLAITAGELWLGWTG